MACERSAPKYSGKGSSCFGVNSFCKIQVAACPKHRCLFDSAIAEETKHDCLCPRNGNNFPEGERFPTPCFLSRRILFLPLGETDDQNCCKYHLQQRHNPISHIPRGSAGKHRSHDVGSKRRSHSPHTMQPAHMLTGVMQRHIIIQGGVDASCSQSIGNRP